MMDRCFHWFNGLELGKGNVTLNALKKLGCGFSIHTWQLIGAFPTVPESFAWMKGKLVASLPARCVLEELPAFPLWIQR
jgi:hypothetical protein